jgi:hypothetical protein
MNPHLNNIALRKSLLLDLIEAQRLEMAVLYTSVERPARLASQVNHLVRNPFVVAGLGVFAAKLPWRRFFRVSGWAWRGWKWYKLLRTVRRFAF